VLLNENTTRQQELQYNMNLNRNIYKSKAQLDKTSDWSSVKSNYQLPLVKYNGYFFKLYDNAFNGL
jgi:hypothetical protein